MTKANGRYPNVNILEDSDPADLTIISKSIEELADKAAFVSEEFDLKIKFEDWDKIYAESPYPVYAHFPDFRISQDLTTPKPQIVMIGPKHTSFESSDIKTYLKNYIAEMRPLRYSGIRLVSYSPIHEHTDTNSELESKYWAANLVLLAEYTRPPKEITLTVQVIG
jgi:hypothetical protein